MPNSPSVKFTIENNNIDLTTPQIGVSMVLARTEKGPFYDPSKLITSVTQFVNEFGGEFVPDGSASNIEKALSVGSKLRVIRIPGTGYYKGILHPTNTTVPSPSDQQTPQAVLVIGTSNDSKIQIGFTTKQYDQKINGADTFTVKWSKSGNTLMYTIQGKDQDIVLESGAVLTYKAHSAVSPVAGTTIDYFQLNSFLRNSDFLDPVVVGASTIPGVTSVDGLIKWLATSIDGSNTDLTITVAGTAFGSISTTLVSEAIPGSSGGTPTVEQWVAGLEYAKDYIDPYQIFCSHLHQHLTTTADQLAVHKAAKEMLDELEEYVYFIEVPKYKSGTTIPQDKASIKAWIESCVGTIGNSKWVAYFAGGLKYYNTYGILVDSDCIGSVVGLGDASAAVHGPWRSFAGMNRGVIYDAHGTVSINYGSPGRYPDLNELANSYANMMVVRDTPNSGKQTMLWHCFTSQVKQDSFKFLSVVKLVLYLKKYLRPILESYIEEPNLWTTWNQIYFQVKPELDRLVEASAMSEYTWAGDQFATSYDDLVINKELDVRQGRYKVKLAFKEVVPMQEINITLSIDKASNTVSATVDE